MLVWILASTHKTSWTSDKWEFKKKERKKKQGDKKKKKKRKTGR